MICQETQAGWLMISQPSHAWVSGQLAHAWAGELSEPLILATSLHDIGWGEWDAQPPLLPDGRPVNFTQASLEDTDGHWRRAVAMLSIYNPYAAVLVSKHASLVYRVRMERGVDPEPESQRRLQTQQDIQNRLIEQMQAVDAAQIEVDYDILRACDLLSLAICTGPLAAGKIEQRAINMTYQPVDEQTLAITPFPFRASAVEVKVEARELPQKTFADLASYHAVLDAAPWQYLTFKFVAGA